MDPGRLQQHLEAVANAFAVVPRPKTTKRVTRAIYECFPDEARWRELEAQDKEQHWQELSDGDLTEFADILDWMDPEAVLFYYPAFLSYALRHWKDSHDRVQLEVMEMPGYDPRMLNDFSAERKELVHAILKELAESSQGSDYNYWPTLTAFRETPD